MPKARNLLVAALALSPWSAALGDQIYNVTALGSNDFIPFEDDGTPDRPRGDHLGNTVTFAGTSRYLTHVQVVFASIGPKEIDTYTLDLYKNDGAPDPGGSGLRLPGTLIAEYKVDASNQPLPGNGGYGVDWNFAPTLVPDTLTAVVSSSYSTTTPHQLMGPFAAAMQPITGTAVNTVWYGDGTPGGWVADPNWAIADGGATNYFDMNFDAVASAVPEPASVLMLGIGVASLLGLARRRRGSSVSAEVGCRIDGMPARRRDRVRGGGSRHEHSRRPGRRCRIRGGPDRLPAPHSGTPPLSLGTPRWRPGW